MGILLPLALAALPLLGVIIALYLLKLRRPVAPIGSLYLWESLTRDREANSLWQRLKVSVLLILQLAALLALVLALARPWVSAVQTEGRNLIVVLDTSASMATTDGDGTGAKTRLQAAKDRAISLVDGLAQDGTAALIAADNHASLVVPPSSDRARLRDAIGGLTPRATDTDMSEAVKLSSVLSSRQPDTSVWVLSDGDFAAVDDVAEPISGEVHFVPVGQGRENAGISALSLQEQSGTLQLFAQIASSADFSVTKRIDFTLDDQPWTARSVILGPNATQELVVEDVPISARVVEAQLAEPDSLDMDNRAWVVNRASVPANVLMVSDGDKFLELALSLLPNVNLYKVASNNYRPTDLLNGSQPDLTIFDASVPTDLTKNPPQGNILLISPPQDNGLVQVTGVISNPVPTVAGGADEGATQDQTDQSSRDPLLRYVDLSGLHVAKSQHMEQPAWARTVLGSDKGPLIIAGEDSGRKVAAVGFDLHDTDLPLQTAFPLLVRNLITSLLPDPSGGLPDKVAPGTTVGINALNAQVDRIIVEDPSAKERSYPVKSSARVAFPETNQLGVYYVSQYAGADLVDEQAFAVNLFSRDESMIAPNQSPGLPGLAATGGEQSSTGAGTRDFKREIWPVAALVGLLVLLVEWAYAQRVVIRRAIVGRRARRDLERALRAE